MNMTYHDVADVLVLVACFFWTWREIVARWSLFIIWGFNRDWWRGFRSWRAFRLTGVCPVEVDFDLDEWVKKNGRAHLVWTLFGSSVRK